MRAERGARRSRESGNSRLIAKPINRKIVNMGIGRDVTAALADFAFPVAPSPKAELEICS
jgi:hypothetical protein